MFSQSEEDTVCQIAVFAHAYVSVQTVDSGVEYSVGVLPDFREGPLFLLYNQEQ